MAKLGKYLESLREDRGYSIEDVSLKTKIKQNYIKALEDENIKVLPMRVYTVGFLKILGDLYRVSDHSLIDLYDEIYSTPSNNFKYMKGENVKDQVREKNKSKNIEAIKNLLKNNSKNEDKESPSKSENIKNEANLKKRSPIDKFTTNIDNSKKNNYSSEINELGKKAYDSVNREFSASKLAEEFKVLFGEEDDYTKFGGEVEHIRRSRSGKKQSKEPYEDLNNIEEAGESFKRMGKNNSTNESFESIIGNKPIDDNTYHGEMKFDDYVNHDRGISKYIIIAAVAIVIIAIVVLIFVLIR